MSTKGKQSEGKRKEDSFDLEQHFILRLPPGQAMALAHELENSNNLKDNLQIDINPNPEHRWGTVRYGGEVINAKLVDLPCIMETLKTTDNKTFYKAADISQMLICSNDMEPSDEEAESPKKKKEKDKRNQYPHGVCPPLKNVRRRRFRKTLTKKPIDLASIEKEVKRLLRMDLEAIEVKYEEVSEDGPQDTTTSTKGKGKANTSASAELLDEEKLFGEISSSEDEAGSEVNISVDDDSDTEQLGVTPITQPASNARSDLDMDGDEIDDDEDVIVQRIMELKSKLSVLEQRINSQENEVRSTQNMDLRRRFESILDELYADKNDLMEQIQKLENH